MKNSILSVFAIIIFSTSARSQSACVGEWSSLAGLPMDFVVTEDNKVEFSDHFSVFASCALISASIATTDITDGSFSVDFGNNLVISGTISGTFSENGQTAQGNLAYTVHLCGEAPVSITWLAQANGPCNLTNSVGQYLDADDVRLFPNPAKGYFTLETNAPSNSHLKYSLFNAHGQQVREGSLHQSSQVIYTRGLAKGMYVLKVVKDGHSQATRQVIIY